MPRDYYSVLARAAAELAPNTDEARRALYDRARLAVMDAGLPPPQTAGERSALEAAIERIEAEVRQAEVRQADARTARSPPRNESEPVRAATRDEARRPAWPGSIRLLALAGATVLAIAVVAYAVWPRKGDPASTPAVASVSEGRSSEGSAGGDRSYVYMRQLVYYRTIHPVGTIVIVKSQRNLYLVRPNVAAIRYTIGIGRECTNAVGLLAVSAKHEMPERQATLASAKSGSPGQPANAGADRSSLALGDTGHRIYATDRAVDNAGAGCFALAAEDLADLYSRVAIGARVVIS